jgi:hypothetical protein
MKYNDEDFNLDEFLEQNKERLNQIAESLPDDCLEITAEDLHDYTLKFLS